MGPFSLLTKCVKANNDILVALRNNKKLLGKVKAFDRHMNMVMENVQEIWIEMPKKGKKGQPQEKIRYLPKLFLRGDSIIYVLKNPKWFSYKIIIFKHHAHILKYHSLSLTLLHCYLDDALNYYTNHFFLLLSYNTPKES